MHARMRKALPNACFIGFTGTPVKRKEKNTINKFGGLIDTYTIRQAVEDKAVVPLLYEGRDVEQQVDRKTHRPVVRPVDGQPDHGAEGRPEEEVRDAPTSSTRPSRR